MVDYRDCRSALSTEISIRPFVEADASQVRTSCERAAWANQLSRLVQLAQMRVTGREKSIARNAARILLQGPEVPRAVYYPGRRAEREPLAQPKAPRVLPVRTALGGR